MNPHEAAFVECFIVKPRRERALELLASSKNRHKLTSNFDHHGRDYMIPECIRPIGPRYQHPPDIAGILRTMGAPETCHVIGGQHDEEDMDLLAALKEIVGWDAHQEDTEKRTRKLTRQLEEQKNLKSELLRAKLRGEVCQSDYAEGNAEFSREIKETEKELRSLDLANASRDAFLQFLSWRSWTSRSYGEPRMRTNAGEFELFFSRTGFWLVPIARFRTRRTPHCSMF